MLLSLTGFAYFEARSLWTSSKYLCHMTNMLHEVVVCIFGTSFLQLKFSSLYLYCFFSSRKLIGTYRDSCRSSWSPSKSSVLPFDMLLVGLFGCCCSCCCCGSKGNCCWLQLLLLLMPAIGSAAVVLYGWPRQSLDWCTVMSSLSVVSN